MSFSLQKIRLVLVIFAFLALALGQGSGALAQERLRQFEDRLGDRETNSRKVSDMLERATVWVLVDGEDAPSFGTGFVVAPGYVVTNAHVVWELPRGGDILIGNDVLPLTEAKLVTAIMDRTEVDGVGGRDLALLRYEEPAGVVLPPLVFNQEVSRMDKVGTWGYPAVLSNIEITLRGSARGGGGFKPPNVVYTEGTVSSFLDSPLCLTLVHTASVSGGNSGGPLINSRGEVVAINTWIVQDSNAGNYMTIAQAASEIVEFLISNGVKPRLASGQLFAGTKKGRPAPLVKAPGQSAPRASLSQPRGGGSQAPPRPYRIPPRNSGRLRDLASFRLEVPDGWAVEEEEEDAIILSTLVPGTWLYLGMIPNEGLPTSLIAKIYAEELENSTPPIRSDEYLDTYVSFGTIADNDIVLVVSGDHDSQEKVAVFMLSGNLDDPGVGRILDSIVEK
ncbi:MAG: trypsin-like peptidase domain-containing protein [Deltaproteobacteria bacterium]|jgi:S1-C subfamily serine protease|nr:trypsin-like peptidase domain-containing protein [Deltaproteobacteria bacterium]